MDFGERINSGRRPLTTPPNCRLSTQGKYWMSGKVRDGKEAGPPATRRSSKLTYAEGGSMPKSGVLLVLLVLLACPAVSGPTRGTDAFGKLPLSFEPNRGQAAPQVEYLANGPGFKLFLTATQAVLCRNSEPHTPLRMKLVGANRHAHVDPSDRLPGTSNYFLGDDPSKWRAAIPNYARVTFEEVYPGTDMVYYGHLRQLEYDLVLKPGADVGRIRIRFEGGSLRVDDS